MTVTLKNGDINFRTSIGISSYLQTFLSIETITLSESGNFG